MITFFVPGIPKPGGSKTVFRNPVTNKSIVTDSSGKDGKNWRASVQQFAIAANVRPSSKAVKLTIHFFFLRPKGHYGKRGLLPSAPVQHTVKPDCTKLVRAVEDALKCIAWKDDAQVVMQVAGKSYGEKSGAEIQIEEL